MRQFFCCGWVFVLILFSCTITNANDRLDSLKRELVICKDDSVKVHILMDITKTMFFSHVDSALSFVNQAEALAKEINNSSLISQVYYLRGNVFFNKGLFDEALEDYFKVLPISESINDRKTIFGINNSVGVIYDRKKNYTKARAYYFMAHEQLDSLQKEFDDRKYSELKSLILSNIGAAFESDHKFEEALAYYQKALEYSTNYGFDSSTANIYSNIGNLHLDRGEMDQVIDYLEKGLEIRERENDKVGLVKSYKHIGKYYFLKEEYSKAVNYLKKSVDLGQEIGSLEYVMYSSDILSDTYKELGDYKHALEQHALYKQLSDSIFNRNSTYKIAQLEKQYELEKQKSREEAKQKEKEARHLMIGAILLFLVMISLLLAIIQRNKVKRTQLVQKNLELERESLEDKLEFRNKELATKAIYMIRRNELINDISERLMNLKKNLKKDNVRPVQKIVMELQSDLDERGWGEFELRFQEVHEEFYNNLTKRFPDLSPAEKKLCAFLRLNMTTKEICEILKQNAKSVEVARTRLRKKLNLTNTDANLVTFIAQF